MNIDTKKIIDDAETILLRIINDCAENAHLQAFVYENEFPAIVDTGASDWDSICGAIRFCPTADIDEDGEERFPADDFDAFCDEIEKFGIPKDCVDKSDDGRMLFITFPRGCWIEAFRKFVGFEKYNAKELEKAVNFNEF